MSDLASDPPFSWGWSSLRAKPVRYVRAILAVSLRLFMGVFFVAAGVNKLRQGWPWSDRLREVFEDHLLELDPEAFGAMFLDHVGIPFYMPIAWVITFGELAAGIGLLLGLASRWFGVLAFWLIFMIGVGGYYDASLLPLGLMCAIVIASRSGHYLGLDRRLAARYPDSRWFR